MTTTPLLQAKDLSIHFPILGGIFRKEVGRVQAVSDVNLALNSGEAFGVVGESGCGKTTLGRLLVGLYAPTKGQIFYEGKDISLMSGSERKRMSRDIQIVFQDPYASLNPRKRIGDILNAPFEYHNMPGGQSRTNRVHELLDLVGLSQDSLLRYPHEFSGGQRQRIGIARALALNPKIVVLDEPLSALDVSIQSQVLNLLVSLQQRLGLTYVFISHDLSVVQYLCDTVSVMYLGKIVETAKTTELFASPQHPYTRSLLDSVPHPDPRRKKVDRILEGDVASASNPPPGCHFHTRCPVAKDVCRTKAPVLKGVGHLQAGADHLAACHFS